jgi:outer membrane protein TolC
MRDVIALGSLVLALGAATPASAQEAPPVEGGGGMPAVGFAQAVRQAIEKNPSAVTAVEEIKHSEGLVKEARSAWLPTLSANATYTKLDANRVSSGVVVAPDSSLNGNVTLTVPIIAAKSWMLTARAKEGVEVARLSAVDAKVQVAVAAGRAYLTIVAQKRIVETTIRARDNAKAHEEFAKQRFAGGVGNRLDFVRASQERATNEAEVQQQQIALTKAQEALGVLMADEGPIDAAGDTGLGSPPTLASALAETSSRRSDVVAQREKTEVARKLARDTYTEYLPILSAMGEPFFETPPTAQLPSTGWQAQLVLSIPLYDGGNRYGLQQERDALYEESKTKLEGILRQAHSDVRLAFESVRRADEALASSREAARLATEALDLAQLAYRAGASTNIEVIDAERSARDADTAVAVAEDAAREARLDLLAACGRFP